MESPNVAGLILRAPTVRRQFMRTHMLVSEVQGAVYNDESGGVHTLGRQIGGDGRLLFVVILGNTHIAGAYA